VNVSVQFPALEAGAQAPVAAVGLVSCHYDLATLTSKALEPGVSPALLPLLEGESAFTPRAGVGQTPRLSWTAPSVGPADAYGVEVFEVKQRPGLGRNLRVARIFTQGTDVRVPPGIMQPGVSYWFRIVAFKDAKYSPRNPLANHANQCEAATITGGFVP
jgi:hypothetical protein